MDVDTFWSLVESSREHGVGDQDKQLAWLVEALSQLPEEEIMAYNRIYHQMHDRAYRTDLWDAAFFINCGCSDDGFTDFRAWLISLGREVFEKTLENPDNLTEVVDVNNWDDVMFEELGYAADDAYEGKTGKDMPYNLPPDYQHPELVGEFHHHEDELAALFPRLLAKLGDMKSRWDEFSNRPPDEE